MHLGVFEFQILPSKIGMLRTPLLALGRFRFYHSSRISTLRRRLGENSCTLRRFNEGVLLPSDRSLVVMPPTQIGTGPEPWSDLNRAAPAKRLNSVDMIDRTEMKCGASEQTMPVIDMAALALEDRSGSNCKEMSEYMARACETWGFFQLINHGIDASLMEKVKEASKGFFKEPEEAKLEHKIRPGVVDGYYSSSLTAVGSNKLMHSVDHLLLFTSPQSRKNLDQWPRNPPAFRETMTKYAEQIQSLALKLMCVLSEELGQERGALHDRLVGPSGEATQALRINYYTPVAAKESPNDSDDLCRLHAHSDPGGLTVLLQNDVAGFEVKRDGQWVAVEPIADALVVNIGDQIEILSNGRYKSIEHRGNAHRTKERLSIATFLSPNYEVVISPMDGLVNDNHPGLYKSVKYHDYFFNFVVKGLNGKQHLRAVEAGVENSQ